MSVELLDNYSGCNKMQQFSTYKDTKETVKVDVETMTYHSSHDKEKADISDSSPLMENRSPSLQRFNKPPNLDIIPQEDTFLDAKGSLQKLNNNDTSYTNDEDNCEITWVEHGKGTSLSEESPSSAASTPLIILTKQVVRVMDAGINGPPVNQSVKIDQLPQTADAASENEKSETRPPHQTRHDSFNLRRQQTPGVILSQRQQFLFECGSPGSQDENDTVSVRSHLVETEESVVHDENTTKLYSLPPMEVAQEKDSFSHSLDCIADSLGPSTLFKNTTRPEKKTSLKEKRSKFLKKAKDSQQVEETPQLPPSGKTPGRLLRFKFSSMKSVDPVLMEGWDSLARALARVGVTAPYLSHPNQDELKLNPKLIPILKRNNSLPEKLSLSNGVPTSLEPGKKSGLRKKTVSFSRLPTKWKIQNAYDCVSRMCEEQQFMKLRSNARVYSRVFWLDQNENCLRWKPSKKDPGKARIDISNIREVRSGKTTELFLSSEISRHFPDDVSFSVIYGDGVSLDLIAESAAEANIWITGLRCLLTNENGESMEARPDARDDWLSSVFASADINGDGYLDEEESFTLISTLSDGVRELSIKQMLQERLKEKAHDEARLSRDEFITLFKEVATRPEIYFLLVRYATSDDRLSVDDLCMFLESEQGFSNVTDEDCLEIIRSFEPSESMRSIPALGIDGFTKYLVSDRCNIFNPKHLDVCQDMNQPLSHYFIASSHNTYLMEDQYGVSNISAYIRALLRCCRCVELDCWDGQDGHPVVTHGHTRNNSIPLKHVINAINDSAFHNSPYPVILCIENHCSRMQQIKMANILKDVFGKNIYVGGSDKESTFLPSPEFLRNRFLIRSRRLSPDITDDVGYVTDDDEGEELLAESLLREESSRKNNQGKSKHELVRDLSDLVSLYVTTPTADDFSNLQHSNSCQQTYSFHEEVAYELAKHSPEKFVSYNKRFLTRVYPSGYRRDSSNFNPQDCWNCGVQIAALNYQTPGLMMDINDGKFSMNGGCGYVLKPEALRNELEYINVDIKDNLPGIAPKILHLRIISGQNIPKPRGGGAKGHVIDPYVLIELFGFPPDCADQRTRTALNNCGDSPIFDELFEFHLVLPSQALVRFVVLDDDFIGDEFIGQYTIPFDCLLPGYRHLKLRSLFDELLDDASLFVHIAISDPESTSPISYNLNPTLLSSSKKEPSKRVAQKRLRKQKSKKDVLNPFQITNIPEADGVFDGAREDLQLASALCAALRSSLASFKEACGLTPLATVKQCIRVLAMRISSDQNALSNRTKRKKSSESLYTKKSERKSTATSSDVDASTLVRQPSDASQSSSEASLTCPVRVRFSRDQNTLAMNVQGAAISDGWRRVEGGYRNLIVDCTLVINQALNCCNNLASAHEKASKLYESVFSYGQSDSPLVSQDSGVFMNGTIGRKQRKAKKLSFLGDEFSNRRKNTVLDNFVWNCSAIKGRRDALYSCHKLAEDILSDIQIACEQRGLIDDRPQVSAIDPMKAPGTPKQSSQSSNNNNNGSVKLHKLSFKETKRRVGLRRSGSTVAKLSLRPRSPAIKRSLSDETLPVATT